jgi:hypothetical protein
VLGLAAKSKYDSSNSDGHCLPDDQCDATGKDRRSNAYGLATASTIVVIVGAAALAGGVVLYLTAPREALRDRTALVVGPAGASVVRSF